MRKQQLTPIRTNSKLRECFARNPAKPLPLLPLPLAREARSAPILLDPGGGCESSLEREGGAPVEGWEDEALTRVSIVGFFTRLIHSGRPRGRLIQANSVSITIRMLQMSSYLVFGLWEAKRIISSPVES